MISLSVRRTLSIAPKVYAAGSAGSTFRRTQRLPWARGQTRRQKRSKKYSCVFLKVTNVHEVKLNEHD